MERTFSKALPLLIILAVAVFVLGCVGSSYNSGTPSGNQTTTTTQTTTGHTIDVSTKAGISSYLVDSNGMTLYYYTKDAYGKSTAAGAILANWPVFYTASITVPSSLSVSDFGMTTATDGSMMTTYKGWPLYHYIGDKAAGDTNGQAVGGVWYVATPGMIQAQQTNASITPVQSSGATASVSVYNFAFNPQNITVSVGTKVTWTNSDPVAHTVTANDGSFDSGQFGPGNTYSYTFTHAGVYSYYCRIHPHMTGTVTVQ